MHRIVFDRIIVEPVSCAVEGRNKRDAVMSGSPIENVFDYAFVHFIDDDVGAGVEVCDERTVDFYDGKLEGDVF